MTPESLMYTKEKTLKFIDTIDPFTKTNFNSQSISKTIRKIDTNTALIFFRGLLVKQKSKEALQNKKRARRKKQNT